jgi:hypothetical protein
MNAPAPLPALIAPTNIANTVAEMKATADAILQIQQDLMRKDVHYGVIPGTDKPTLLKPGAEKLCAAFHIAPKFEIEDLSFDDAIRYRVTCRGFHQATGVLLGEGSGECSSNEEKYKWRRANGKEFEDAPENRRRVKYGYNKQSRESFEIRQVRTESADLANTVLKMAQKRAHVAMTLIVLAASDVFTQDVEDGIGGGDGDGDKSAGKRQRRRPQPTGGSGASGADQSDDAAPISDGERANLTKHLAGTDGGLSMADLRRAFGRETLDGMTRGEFRKVKAWIMDPVGYEAKAKESAAADKAV